MKSPEGMEIDSIEIPKDSKKPVFCAEHADEVERLVNEWIDDADKGSNILAIHIPIPINSSGFGIIVKIVWNLRHKGYLLTAIADDEKVAKNFQVIGLDKSLAGVYQNLEALLADLDKEGEKNE